jgi:lycopene cyclase domain-containing protein
VTYTGLAVLTIVTVLLIEAMALKTGLLKKIEFYLAYGIVVFFQLLTNGYLTGREIVLYDSEVILGLRVAFAPLEDLMFGFALVFFTMAVWTKIGLVEENRFVIRTKE